MNRIKELRKVHKVSQKQLAEYLGTSRSTVSMWEIEASQPDNDLLISISDFLTSQSITCSEKATLRPRLNKKA